MRICIPTFFYKPSGGGVPTYVDNISKKLAELGHKIDIITVSFDGKKVEKDGNITVYRLPSMNIFKNDDEDNKEKTKKFFKFLKRYMRRKPDIFFAQNMHAAINGVGHTLALNMISMEYNIPIVLVVHSFLQEDETEMLKTHLIKDLPWKKIVCVGSHLAESLFNKGISSDDIKIINPPVNTEKFKPGLGKKWLRTRVDVSEKDFVILHASRLNGKKTAEEKGVYNLLKALPLIKEKKVKVIFGAAPTAEPWKEKKKETIERIKETAKLLGVENRIFIETFDPDSMHLVYNGADLFVMASQMESFGLVYAEALACEIPVIGTSVGGIPEVIEDGKSGELLVPDDHVLLAKTIKKIIKNYGKMKKMGEYGRKSVIKRFEIEKIAKNIEGLLDSIIKEEKEEKSKN